MKMTTIVYMVVAVLLTTASAHAGEASGCLAGQVVDLETSKPIVGAWVMALRTGDIKQTDAAGCFRIDEILGRKSTGLAIGFGLGLKKTKSIDPGPKKIVVIAKGYKAFSEEVPIVSADAGRFTAIVERIALAPVHSSQDSGIARLSAPEVQGLGEDFQFTVSPAVVTDRDTKVTLTVVVDIPQSVPISYQVKAVVSNGKKVTLKLQEGPETSLVRTYEAAIDVGDEQNALEIMVGSVVATTMEKMGTMFMVGPSTESWNPYAFAMPEGVAKRMESKLLSSASIVVCAPGASPGEQEKWRLAAVKTLAPHAVPEISDVQSLLEGVPDGTAKQFFTLSERLWSGADRTEVMAAIDAAVTAKGSTASELLVREWALAHMSRLTGAAGAPAAETVVHKAFDRIDRYGPAMRALGNMCLDAGYHKLAGECFRKAEAALGDLDGSIARSTGKFYSFEGAAYAAPGKEAADGLEEYARAKQKPSAKSYLRAAEKLQQAELLPLAVDAAERSIELEATADAYVLLGAVRDTLGEDDTPLDAYNRAVELDSRHVAAHFHRGLSSWGHGRFDDAMQSFQSTASLDDSAEYRQATAMCEAWLLSQKPGDLAAWSLARLFLSHGSVLPGTDVLCYGAARRMLSSSEHPALHLIVAALSDDRDEIDAALTAPVTSPFWKATIQAAAVDSYLRLGYAERAIAVAKEITTSGVDTPDGVPDKALEDQLRQLHKGSIAFVTALASLPTDATQ